MPGKCFTVIRTPPSFVRRFGLPLLYAAVLLCSVGISHFAILSNDVFPLRWQAEHLSFHDPATFYNGFFPIGYPLLDWLASVIGNPVLTMMLLQIALAPVYVFLVQRILMRVNGRDATVAALPLVLFAPQIISNVLSATPDFLAALCVLVGFRFIFRDDRPGRFVTVGIALGIGYLFRAHVIVLALALAAACLFIERPRPFRACGLLLLGTVPFVVAQGILQVWSGHGFFESDQAFNIWRMMHGSNWNHPPALSGASATGVILSDPGLFFTALLEQLLSESLYLIPCLLALILLAMLGRIRSQRPIAIILTATILYLLVTACGGSPRNIIIIAPVVAAALMLVIDAAMVRIAVETKRRTALAVGTVLWALGAVGTIVFSLHADRRVEDYREVERLLHVGTPAEAAHIFTDDFDLYFPDLRYTTPRTSGGWPELGLPAYAARFPHIPDSTAAVLHASLGREGIHWAVFRQPPYNPALYLLVSTDTSQFHLTYATPRHKIYRVE